MFENIPVRGGVVPLRGGDRPSRASL